MSSEQRIVSPFPSSFNRDLENARVLIEDSPWRDNPQKYRKVAEGILRRILTVDPENESAKHLLAKAETPALEMPSPPPPPPPRDFSFVVQTIGKPVESKKKEPARPPWVLVGFGAVGAIAGILIIALHPGTAKSQYTPKAPISAPSTVQAKTETSRNDVPAAAESATVAAAPVLPNAIPDPVPKPEPASSAAVITTVKSNIPPVAPIETGTLAVSSPATVDIYMGEQLVGSAPTTLVLPVGNQTLEYRHQDMRKVMTHMIKANETTTAMITFDIPVQINARPWAQVSIDGPQKQLLGQTPLSGVRVPIGSTLIFENPNFPGKRYRVTGMETEIRVTFP